MIHFDALDFSEWHSEEVISFFWCSVYFAQNIHIGFWWLYFQYENFKLNEFQKPVTELNYFFQCMVEKDCTIILSPIRKTLCDDDGWMDEWMNE